MPLFGVDDDGGGSDDEDDGDGDGVVLHPRLNRKFRCFGHGFNVNVNWNSKIRILLQAIRPPCRTVASLFCFLCELCRHLYLNKQKWELLSDEDETISFYRFIFITIMKSVCRASHSLSLSSHLFRQFLGVDCWLLMLWRKRRSSIRRRNTFSQEIDNCYTRLHIQH